MKRIIFCLICCVVLQTGLHAASYQAVVAPGQSIQAAIEAAPDKPEQPYVIFIKNGIYNQKVIIDKPNIVLLGEHRDSTRIILAEIAGKSPVKEYKGKRPSNGVIVLQEGANDCIISGLTVYNNYGSTVEKTTTHQMAIFGRATRTIVINCNVWADGNDALSLWAPSGNGMYYHADLDLRCPGVDFLCPRGWCYATRCTFYGDGRAMIWHDGRGDIDKKLVITDSHFDSKSPVTLGRYHHDSQFYLLNCTMTDKIIDHPIGYAYTDQVLDSCPWGQRVYMYNIQRIGGTFDWMRDNLQLAKGSPNASDITAKWTFGGAWDPEARIDTLWKVLAYEKKQVIHPIVVPLWPNGAPNSNGLSGDEILLENGRVSNVTNPTLTVYPAKNGNGMAIIACPGGAYIRLAMQHEGHDMAAWFNEQGITYAVLKYRMPNGHFEVPMADVLQAIRIMRQQGNQWGVVSNNIGIMGSSAGGHLASSAATHYTSNEDRPDFQILFYPAIILNKPFAKIMFGENALDEMMDKYSNDKHVTAETPPAIIFCSADDRTTPPDHGITYFKALNAKKISATLHIYPAGMHGWGYKDSFPYKRQWTDMLEKWLRDLNK